MKRREELQGDARTPSPLPSAANAPVGAAPELFGLIVAGGSGTRLWPMSRATKPKQLLALNGDPHSLLQNTFARMMRSVRPERIHLVTGMAHRQQALQQLRALVPEYPEAHVLAEPTGRDSAPAVLWGALEVHRRAPDAVLVVVWSDQMIRNETALDEAVRRAQRAVRDGGLAAIGVQPRHPLTTLGYVRYGRELGGGAYAVERFVEKPSLPVAERLLAEGRCVWNAGIFVFHVGTLLEEFERLAPELLDCFRGPTREGGAAAGAAPGAIERIYARLPSVSIDHLLLEKTDRLVVVPADLDWSDLGAWDELHRQHDQDEAGNVANGRTVLVDTSDSYVQGGKRLIAAVGVSDLVVVDTDDALLICDMRRTQDIKRLVQVLDERGCPEAGSFGETERPWGSYAVLHEEAGCKVKVLDVRPHQILSLQQHRHRAEHWIVIKGRPVLTCGESSRAFDVGESVHIPCGATHRIANPGNEPVRIIEVQQGDYLGEDDIIRLEDAYGRA